MTRDPIDELLDDPTPLPDDGFTARVMVALPRRRSPAPPLETWLLALGAGLVTVVLAPDAAALARSLADGLAGLAGGLGPALAAGGGRLPVTGAALAAAIAFAALGAWLVAEPA
jgi:hypothetical protein